KVPAKLARNHRNRTMAIPDRIAPTRIALCLSCRNETSLDADALYFGGFPATRFATTSKIENPTPVAAAQRSAVQLAMCPPLQVTTASCDRRRTAVKPSARRRRNRRLLRATKAT